MGTLTVRENLHFSASLRLSRKLSKRERSKRVEETLSDLGLFHVAESKVRTDKSNGNGNAFVYCTYHISLVAVYNSLRVRPPTSRVSSVWVLLRPTVLVNRNWVVRRGLRFIVLIREHLKV